MILIELYLIEKIHCEVCTMLCKTMNGAYVLHETETKIISSIIYIQLSIVSHQIFRNLLFHK